MTTKLPRYYTDALSTHSDWDEPAQLVCKDADVSALKAENERLREGYKVLSVLLAACEKDFIGDSGINTDIFPDEDSVMDGIDSHSAITFGMIRKARETINREQEKL